MYQCYGVLDSGTSDHSLTFPVRKKKKLPQKNRCVWAKSYRIYNRVTYYNVFLETDWSPLLECTKPESAVDLFHQMILPVIENHTLHKFIKAKDGNTKLITYEFLSLLDNRRYHLKKYKQYPTEENWEL